MRKLVVTQNITADGSIEMLGDWFDPQGQADQSDLIEEVHRQDSHSDAFLTGRHTFEAMRGYWPEQTEDPTGVTAYLNDVRKYVVSSMINDPQWQNTTVLSGDPIQQVRALKEPQGQDIVITGSISPCSRAGRSATSSTSATPPHKTKPYTPTIVPCDIEIARRSAMAQGTVKSKGPQA